MDSEVVRTARIDSAYICTLCGSWTVLPRGNDNACGYQLTSDSSAAAFGLDSLCYMDGYALSRRITCQLQEKNGAANGIDKSGQGESDNPRRVRGSEVFVGGLQRKATEQNLREVFSKCGDILEVRIMKDSAGVSKGYAFVRFISKAAAQRAQKEKNGTMLQGKKIGVTPSADQDTLFLGNLRKEWGRQELEEMVIDAFQDVLSVELAMPPGTGESPVNKKQQNRGFAFVHFATHAAAARAFRTSSKPEFMLGGKWRPAVDWAENELDPDPEEMSKVKTAFVGNLPNIVDENFLRRLFDPYGKIERVAVSRKGNCPVGFIHFVQRSHVEAAIEALNGKLISGPDRGPAFKLQVSLAKPVDKTRKRSHEEYQNQNASILPAGISTKVCAGALGIYAPTARAYGDYTDYVVTKNPLVDDPYAVSLYSLPTSGSTQLQNILRAGVAMGLEVQKDKPLVDALAMGRTLDYGPLAGSQASVRDGQLSAHGPSPGSRLSILDSYNSLAGAPSFTDTDHHGYDAYVNYSLNSLTALPTISPGLLGGQPLLSRISTVAPETYGLASLRNTASLGVSMDAGGVGTVDSNGVVRRPFKFDPYTGEPYKFDPFTGEPLHLSTMAALQPSNLVALQATNTATNRLAGKYY